MSIAFTITEIWLFTQTDKWTWLNRQSEQEYTCILFIVFSSHAFFCLHLHKVSIPSFEHLHWLKYIENQQQQQQLWFKGNTHNPGADSTERDRGRQRERQRERSTAKASPFIASVSGSSSLGLSPELPLRFVFWAIIAGATVCTRYGRMYLTLRHFHLSELYENKMKLKKYKRWY